MRWRGPAGPTAGRTRRAIAIITMVFVAGCGDTPTTPTPPPPSALEVTCPSPLGTVATSAGGAPVFFGVPTATGGRTPVTVTCSATSGQVFPVGTTTVTCTARDVVNQLAACAFDVRVTAAPRLSRSRFLAFGDSITAGEVTVPMAGPNDWTRLIVVPAASYPTVLRERLVRSYVLQTPTVVNAGQPGQSASQALPRFADALNAQQPEVLLLLMGFNDLVSVASVNAAATALTAMARDARLRGIRVFIGTLTPTIPGRQRSMDQSLLDAMNVRIRQIAVTESAVLVDLYEALLPSVGSWIGVDGLHPNEAGYARMADLFYDAIRATLESP